MSVTLYTRRMRMNGLNVTFCIEQFSIIVSVPWVECHVLCWRHQYACFACRTRTCARASQHHRHRHVTQVPTSLFCLFACLSLFRLCACLPAAVCLSISMCRLWASLPACLPVSLSRPCTCLHTCLPYLPVCRFCLYRTACTSIITWYIYMF